MSQISIHGAAAEYGHGDYYRQNGRHYRRERGTGEAHEVSFAEVLRSHQIARELMEANHYSTVTPANLSEAKQIQRGLG